MPAFFPALVYLLCFATSSLCAALLIRAWRTNGAQLLLWSGACFGLLAANNMVVIFDMLIMPDINLRLPRLLLSLAAVSVLLFGLVWSACEDEA